LPPLDENRQQNHPLGFQFKDRVFADFNFPYFQHFGSFDPGKLVLAHANKNDGESRIDLGLYNNGASKVIYIKAIVGNYQTTKLPPSENDLIDRMDTILRIIRKWLGESVFNVLLVHSWTTGLAKMSFITRTFRII
jgi:hypothetical protein